MKTNLRLLILCLFSILLISASATSFLPNEILDPTIAWSFDDDQQPFEGRRTYTVFDGIEGNAWYFTGRNRYGTFPHQDEIALTTEGTLRAWINYNAINTYDGILHKGEKPHWKDESYSLQFWEDRKLIGVIRNEAQDYSYVESPDSLKRNKWYHVIFRWNEDELILSLDGEIVAREPNTVGAAQITPTQLIIGCQVPGRYCPWGKIDEVAIWNRSITDYEAYADYKMIDGAFLTSVSPVLECVTPEGDGTYSAYFGYNNKNNLTIPIIHSEDNSIRSTLSDEQVQPESFLPGRQRNVFCVQFDESNTPVWTLEGPDGNRRTATASTNPAQECQTIPFECVPSEDEDDDDDDQEDSNQEYVGLGGFIKRLFVRMGFIEQSIESLQNNVTLIQNDTKGIQEKLSNTSQSIDDIQNRTKTIDDNVVTIERNLKNISRQQNETNTQLDNISSDIKTILNRTENSTQNISVNVSVNQSPSEELVESIDSLNRSITDTQYSLASLQQNISVQLEEQFKGFRDLFGATQMQLQEGFDFLSTIVVRERTILQDNLTSELDDIDTRLETIETHHFPRLYAYLDEINTTTHLTYQRVDTVSTSLHNAIGNLHYNITTSLAAFENNQSTDAIDLIKLEAIVENATAQAFAQNQLQLSESLEEIAKQIQTSTLQQDNHSQDVIRLLADVETDLRIMNRTLLHKMSTSAESQDQKLNELKSTTDSLVTDLTLTTTTLDNLRETLNQSQLQDEHIEGYVYANQERLIDLLAIVQELNRSQHQEVQQTAFFEQQDEIKTYLESIQSSFTSYDAKITENVETSNKILSTLGFNLSSDQTVRSLLINLLQTNDELLTLTQEINLTTHQNSAYLESLDQRLTQLSGQIDHSLDDAFNRYSNLTTDELQTMLQELDQNIDESFTIMNSSLQKHRGFLSHQLELIANQLDTVQNSQSETKQQLVEQMLTFEQKFITFNESLVQTIQLEQKRTRDELEAYISSELGTLAQEVDTANEILLDLSTAQDDIHLSQDTLNTLLRENRAAILKHEAALLSYSNQINGTLDNHYQELSQEIADSQTELLYQLGYSNTTATLREDIFTVLLNQHTLLEQQAELNSSIAQFEPTINLTSITSHLEEFAHNLLIRSIHNYTALQQNQSQDLLRSMNMMINTLSSSVSDNVSAIVHEIASLKDETEQLEQTLQSQNMSNIYQEIVSLQSQLRSINISLHDTIERSANQTIGQFRTHLKDNMTSLLSSLDELNMQIDGSLTTDNTSATLSLLLENRDLLHVLSNRLETYQNASALHHTELHQNISQMQQLFGSLDERLTQEFDELQTNITTTEQTVSEQTSLLNRIISEIGSLQTNQSLTHNRLLEIISSNNELINLANEINLTTHAIKVKTDATYVMLRDEVFPKIENLSSTLQSMEEHDERTWQQLINLSEQAQQYQSQIENTLNAQQISLDTLHENLSNEIRRNREILTEINTTTHAILKNITLAVIPDLNSITASNEKLAETVEHFVSYSVQSDQNQTASFNQLHTSFEESQNTIEERVEELYYTLLSMDSDVESVLDELQGSIESITESLSDVSCSCAHGCNPNRQCGSVGYEYYQQMQSLITNTSLQTQHMISQLSGEMEPVVDSFTTETIAVLSTSEFRVNNTASLYIHYTNATGNPLTDAACTFTLEGPNNQTVLQKTPFTAYTLGIYEIQWVPERTGTHRATISCQDSKIGYAFFVEDHLEVPISLDQATVLLDDTLNYIMNQSSPSHLIKERLAQIEENLLFGMEDLNMTLQYLNNTFTDQTDEYETLTDTIQSQRSLLEAIESIVSNHSVHLDALKEIQKNQTEIDTEQFTTLLEQQYVLERKLQLLNQTHSLGYTEQFERLEELIIEEGDETRESIKEVYDDLKDTIQTAVHDINQQIFTSTTEMENQVRAFTDQSKEELEQLIKSNRDELISLSVQMDAQSRITENQSRELHNINTTLMNTLNISESLLSRYISIDYANRSLSSEEYGLLINITQQNAEIMNAMTTLEDSVVMLNTSLIQVNDTLREILTEQTDRLTESLASLEETVTTDISSLNGSLDTMRNMLDYNDVVLNKVLESQNAMNSSLKELSSLVKTSFTDLNKSLTNLSQKYTHIVEEEQCDASWDTEDEIVLLSTWNTTATTANISVSETNLTEQDMEQSITFTVHPKTAQDRIIKTLTIPKDAKTLRLRLYANETLPSGKMGVQLTNTDTQSIVMNIKPSTQWERYYLDLTPFDTVGSRINLTIYLNMDRTDHPYQLSVGSSHTSVCTFDSQQILLPYLMDVEHRTYHYQEFLAQQKENHFEQNMTVALESVTAELGEVAQRLNIMQGNWSNISMTSISSQMKEVQHELINLTTQIQIMESHLDALDNATKGSSLGDIDSTLASLRQDIQRIRTLSEYNKDKNIDLYESIQDVENDVFLLVQEINSATTDDYPQNMIYLEKGVNRIIIPKALDDAHIHDTLSPIIEDVSVVFYKEGNRWMTYNPRVLFGNTIETFEFNKPYWILMEHNAILEI